METTVAGRDAQVRTIADLSPLLKRAVRSVEEVTLRGELGQQLLDP